jgi:hypothetical protein
MGKISQFLFLLVSYFLFFVSNVSASGRNIFGLHLTQPNDIFSAKDIINSSGGDWGWVTIVIRSDQLDPQTWQDFFDNCRKFHLIPIVRLATIMDSDTWQRPQTSHIDNLTDFLGSLNWPTKSKHVILFNEINHAAEWGGGVDIKNFVDIAVYAAQKFKEIDPNFTILSSPLDLAAPEKPPLFKSAPNVYREIHLYQPKYFDLVDALASHSYPNHGFVGSPKDRGQHSITGYVWELNFIQNLGIQKTFPVFITETGWPHREGQNPNNRFFTVKTSTQFLKEALNLWSQDPRIIATTPFIYNYPYPPFDHFSWLDANNQLYPSYQEIVDLPKTKNSPPQITKYELVNIRLPFLIFTNRNYLGQITLKNTGQSIWGETKFCLNPATSPNITLNAICLDNSLIYPNDQKTFVFKFRVNNQTSSQKSFIGWQGLLSTEITSFPGNTFIYHSKNSFLSRVKNKLQTSFDIFCKRSTCLE